MIWFTSDFHLYHKNCITFDNRPFTTLGEMHDKLIRNWNEVVTNADTVYYLGDVSFGRPDKTRDILYSLNGNIVLIKGNHDQRIGQFEDRFSGVHDYLELKKERIVLSHYPSITWNWMYYNSIMLHGHCVDMKTEILTTNGWKKRNNLSTNDIIFSYNTTTNVIEQDNILCIIDKNYSGDIYSYKGKSVNFRYTDKHTILFKSNASNKNILKKSIEQAKNYKTISFIHSGSNTFKGIALNNELIKLYILILCDGTIKKETNLIRIRVKKERKIIYIKNILNKLNISFNEYIQKKYMVSINFYLPEELKIYNIKGGDDKLIHCNKNQADSIFESYQYGDGYKNGKGILIYSAKEKEIDLMQSMFCLNGYSTTKYSRIHKNAYSKNKQYQLSVYPCTWKTTFNFNTRLKKETVKNEQFWCIQSNNQNFIMRREGRVHITGNCHGNLRPAYSADGIELTCKRLDVGCMNHNYYPISIDEVHELVDNIPLVTIDHHKSKKE